MIRHEENSHPEDALLRKLSPPTLAPGPHQEELGRALMTELRGRIEKGERQWGAWWVRFGYAAALVFVIAIGVVALKYGQSGSKGVTATIGGKSSERSPASQSSQLVDAIDEGNFSLEQTLPFKPSGRIYLYRAKLAGGGEATFASDRLLGNDPVLVKHTQMLQQAMYAQDGRFVGERVTQSGAKIYRYRVNLADGTEDVYGTDREPDALKQQLHQTELEAAIAQGRGEFFQTIPRRNSSDIFLMKVTLSDGTIKVYASVEKPAAP